MSELSIRVEDMNGQQSKIQVSNSWIYAQLHNKFLEMFGSQAELYVTFGNNYLTVRTHGTFTLSRLKFTDNCVIRVLKVQNLTIIVEDMENKWQTLQVSSSWTYTQLYNQLVQLFGNQGELTVSFGNTHLSVGTHGTATLKELEFTNNCIIRVVQAPNFNIRIEDKKGQRQTLQVYSSWTYAQLHNQLVKMFGNRGELTVTFGMTDLNVGTHGVTTLKQLKFTNNCLISVFQEPIFTIRVGDSDGQLYILNVDCSWTYAQLHSKFVKMFGDQGRLSVIFGTRILSVKNQGALTLEKLKLTCNCVIRVLPRIDGRF